MPSINLRWDRKTDSTTDVDSTGTKAWVSDRLDICMVFLDMLASLSLLNAHAVKSIWVTHMECVLDRPCPDWIGRWTQARSRRTSSVVVKSLDFHLNMMKYLYRILSDGLT